MWSSEIYVVLGNKSLNKCIVPQGVDQLRRVQHLGCVLLNHKFISKSII